MTILVGLMISVLAVGPGPASFDSTESARLAAPASVALAAPRVGGYIQVREVAQERVGITATLNRARLSIDGALPARFSYRLLVELEASAGARSPSTPSLREGYVRWSAAPWAVTAGQFKAPFSREYLIPVPALETADLAVVVDSLAPKYDLGVQTEYAWGSLATLVVGVFNGEGQNASANRDSNLIAVARATLTPIAQMGFGASLSRDGPDSLRWGIDGCLEQSGALLRGEYILRHRRGRDHDRDDRGWSVFGGYRVIPRAQVFGRTEAFERPWAGRATRVRATAVGINVELAPARVRLLVEGLRRRTGLRQARTDTGIAQLQVRF